MSRMFILFCALLLVGSCASREHRITSEEGKEIAHALGRIVP